MENQAVYIGQNILKLGIGVGGALNVLCCASAWAIPAEDFASAGVQLPAATLDLGHLDAAKLAPTATAEPLLLGDITRSLLSSSPRAFSLYPSALNYDHLVAIQDGYRPQFSAQKASQRIDDQLPQTTTTRLTVRAANGTVTPLNVVKLTPSLTTLSALEGPLAANRSSDGHSIDELWVSPSVPVMPSQLMPSQFSVEMLNEADESTADEAVGVAVVHDLNLEALMSEGDVPSEATQAGLKAMPNVLSESLRTDLSADLRTGLRTAQIERSEEQTDQTDQADQAGQPDDELGILRLQQTRSRANEELGILRLMQTAQAPPPSPKPPIAFLTGRLGFFNSNNAFRTDSRRDESIYQSGLAFYLVPKLSDNTSLYAIAETNLARYEDLKRANYNEVEVQLGIRQRLSPRTYAQVGWRHQRLYDPGYREKLFSVNYLDTLISHRSILNSRTWLDSFYQARLGFANQDSWSPSRFRQTFTLSLNHGVTRDLRTSLLYQLDFDDYTQISRYDTYQQFLGIISYRFTPESRLTLFGGTRFGRSSSPRVNLDDTFYGAGINVSVPIF